MVLGSPHYRDVQRRVHFFRARFGLVNGKVPPWEPGKIMDAVAGCAKSGDRYLDIEDGHALCAWPDQVGGRPAVILGTVRRSGLPSLEENGQIENLPVRATQGILERTHVVFFDDGFIGAEFNFYGPRAVSRLPQFLRQKCPDIPAFTMDAMLNRDAAETLANLQDLRVVELEMRRDETALLQSAMPSLGRAFAAAREGLEGTSVVITLKPPPDSGQTLPGAILHAARSALGQPNVIQAAETLKVRGKDRRTGRTEWFDLLQDKLVSTRRAVLEDPRYRAVDSRSMLAQIGLAYEDLRPTLYRAAGLGEP